MSVEPSIRELAENPNVYQPLSPVESFSSTLRADSRSTSAPVRGRTVPPFSACGWPGTMSLRRLEESERCSVSADVAARNGSSESRRTPGDLVERLDDLGIVTDDG